MPDVPEAGKYELSDLDGNVLFLLLLLSNGSSQDEQKTEQQPSAEIPVPKWRHPPSPWFGRREKPSFEKKEERRSIFYF